MRGFTFASLDDLEWGFAVTHVVVKTSGVVVVGVVDRVVFQEPIIGVGSVFGVDEFTVFGHFDRVGCRIRFQIDHGAALVSGFVELPDDFSDKIAGGSLNMSRILGGELNSRAMEA